MQIKDYISKYWTEKKLKKWEYLYKANEKDTNLYFILKWELLLKFKWTNIALVWANEISWEKSFIEWTEKPIDAVAETDVDYLVITVDEFNNINSKEKELFLKKLILFISNRVYLLNSVVQNVSSLSLNIINNKWEINFNTIKNIFWNIFDLKEIYIYKFIWESVIPIFDSKFNPTIVEIVEKYKGKSNLFNSLDWKYLIKSWDYCFVLEWKVISSEYVMNNVILNSIASFSYLWSLIEKQKEDCLQDFLE